MMQLGYLKVASFHIRVERINWGYLKVHHGHIALQRDNSRLCSITLDLTQHEFICDSNPIQNSTTTPKNHSEFRILQHRQRNILKLKLARNSHVTYGDLTNLDYIRLDQAGARFDKLLF